MSTAIIQTTGRRKTAVARVFMKSGTGKIEINGRSFEEFFPTLSLQNILLAPLQLLNLANQYDFTVHVKGGGITGQLGAVILGIARALLEEDPERRGDLKGAGFLKRDPRQKERKKAGRPGARKRFQFSKR